MCSLFSASLHSSPFKTPPRITRWRGAEGSVRFWRTLPSAPLRLMMRSGFLNGEEWREAEKSEHIYGLK